MNIIIHGQSIEILDIFKYRDYKIIVCILDVEIQKLNGYYDEFINKLEDLILYLSEPKLEGSIGYWYELESCYGNYYFKFFTKFLDKKIGRNKTWLLKFESNSFDCMKIYYICG